ncbi:hypothetical protein H0H87_006717 [Tephrocybe sp. NHM501043]|nr:hypothetical protein H0H87_006717 [Tephrocybe sp. NHM501043]
MATELAAICQHLQQQREDSYRDDSARAYQHRSTQELASSISQHLEAYHNDLRRDEYVITDPDNLVVSPLSMFSVLPTQPFALPDETPVPLPASEAKLHSFRSSTCNNQDHLSDCLCSVPCSEPSTHQSSASRSRSAIVNDRSTAAVPKRSDPIPIARPEREVDHYSTNDYADRPHRDHRSSPRAGRPSKARNSSPYSGDRYAHHYNEDSAQPTSSSYTVASTSRPQGHASISRDDRTYTSTTSISTTIQTYNNSPPTQGIKNYVLQNLLQDSSGTSSQMSNPSPPVRAAPIHTPPIPRRDSHRSDEQAAPSLGRYKLPQPSPALLASMGLQPTRKDESPLLPATAHRSGEGSLIPPLDPAPVRPPPIPYNPAYAPVPASSQATTQISFASDAAKAKERERAERAERERRDEKETLKKELEREERRKARRAEKDYAQVESYSGGGSSVSKGNRSSTEHFRQASSSSRHSSTRDPPPPYTMASQRAAASSSSRSNRYREKYATEYTARQPLYTAPV